MGQWSFLSELLDKVQSHSTVFGKVWMSILFLFRIFILAAGVDEVWKDEKKSFKCNTITVGCHNLCYDTTFPISHTRFWVLQILTVSTPTLVYLGHVLLVIRRENKLRRKQQLKGGHKYLVKLPKYTDERGKVQLKGALLVSYVIQLVMKILLEGVFIIGHYFLYGFFLMPKEVSCDQYPCRHINHCFISRPTEKSIFIIFMLAMAGFSVILNIVELLHLVVSKATGGRKRSSSLRPLELKPINKANSGSAGKVSP
ncbi:Gap junction Cx32.2 protein [Oryzias melastigma]|uniref:Gap junction Cx32.2 protein n=1 Tax=Oryzias melastigma TaxID=30732 RepID=A0A834BPB0_ORYME|nr:Gap junction Cx32.2 protein [Oryzias melastigma]